MFRVPDLFEIAQMLSNVHTDVTIPNVAGPPNNVGSCCVVCT